MAATKDQLLEIINGLELMNDELADEVKRANKDKHVAMKLYENKGCCFYLQGEIINRERGKERY